MKIESLALPDVKLIRPARHADARGFLSEMWRRDAFLEAGIDLDFVQDNHSFSRAKGTLRGLHFQSPPFAQAKLVIVAAGAVFDVAVDLRQQSPTFGRSVTAVLSRENAHEMLIPEGFAHGFCTLEADTQVIYKLTAPYAPDHDKGVHWRDPALAIDWPVREGDAVLSDRDRALPLLADLPPYFVDR